MPSGSNTVAKAADDDSAPRCVRPAVPSIQASGKPTLTADCGAAGVSGLTLAANYSLAQAGEIIE